RAVTEKIVAARLAFPVLDAMAGRFELFSATKRINSADRFDECEFVVERDLNLEPLDSARILLQLPRFNRLELIARHWRPAREVGWQQIFRARNKFVAVPKTNRVAEPGMRAVHVLMFLPDVDASYARPIIVDEVRLLRQVDELVRIGLEQPSRIANRL